MKNRRGIQSTRLSGMGKQEVMVIPVPSFFLICILTVVLEVCALESYLVHLQFPFVTIDYVSCVKANFVSKTTRDTVRARTSE